MGIYLHPHVELRTLRVNMCVYGILIDEEIGFHITQKFDEPFGVRFHF